MFLGAIINFLGGAAFRTIWGEVAHFFTQQQDHKQEMEKMQLQASLDAAAHARNLDQLKVQSELGIKEITVKAEADINKTESDAFLAAMEQVNKPTGNYIVDLWNGIIRPSFGTLCLIIWGAKLIVQNFVPDVFDLDLFSTIVGFYFADRSLKHRGK